MSQCKIINLIFERISRYIWNCEQIEDLWKKRRISRSN